MNILLTLADGERIHFKATDPSVVREYALKQQQSFKIQKYENPKDE